MEGWSPGPGRARKAAGQEARAELREKKGKGGKQMPSGARAEAAEARTPSPDCLSTEAGDTPPRKQTAFRSPLLRAPQRAQPPVGCG